MSIQLGNLNSWKKALLVAIATFALILSGCGGGGNSTVSTETEAIIDDIVQDLLQNASTDQEEITNEEVEAASLDAEVVLPRAIGESADER